MDGELRYSLPLSERDNPENTANGLKMVHILKAGKFWMPAYDENGEYYDGELEITTEMLDEMVSNYQTDVSRGQERPVDYNHSMMQALSAEDGKAAGWIKNISRIDNDLYALVEWNNSAKKYIEEKEYKYTSSMFAASYIDIETRENVGMKLKMFSLTNTPHIPGLKAVSLSENKPEKQIHKHVATAAQARSENTEGVMKMEIELSEKLTNAQNEVVELREQLGKEQTSLVELREQFNAAVAERDSKAKEVESAQVKLSEVEKLNAELVKQNAVHDVELKIREGFIRKTQRDQFIELKLSNSALYDSMTKEKVVDERIHGVDDHAPTEVGDYMQLTAGIMKEKNVGLEVALREAEKLYPAEHKAHYAKFFKKGVK